MSEKMIFSHFPSAVEMYIQNGDRRFLKRCRNMLRYSLARLICGNNTDKLIDFINKNPIWSNVFKQDLHRFNAILFKHADKRFSAQQRLDTICNTFVEIESLLGSQKSQQLVEDNTIKLVQLTDDFSLNLDIYTIDPFEGFFSLSLVDNENNHLYNASFVLLSENRLLVTCIQGPRGEEAQAIVRNLTKKLHGTRPMYLLVEGFKVVAQGMGKTLVGIPLENQVKKRWYGSQKVHFDYNAFWQENGAMRANDYWQLPLQIERRNLDEVATKKRSMYRKRYAMFDLMETEIIKGIKA
ncbi:Protein of uncharacterised function (DUF535) [Phocoenobacter uteri]|uniref:Protein of uncharacterized function (DUF535) n=1 Tax=Phocoenobacter uteri TaxID=146806 RepID=A0A379C9A5_9PAST|nr:DUF535 family protein [Phocoenobacter uteri]MDG6882544.1 hypothetical protein [Phocoenobacter uteri]SUB58708.1 Protein of uncharacterised function (DUF535) [Phocoenobacter uteri]